MLLEPLFFWDFLEPKHRLTFDDPVDRQPSIRLKCTKLEADHVLVKRHGPFEVANLDVCLEQPRDDLFHDSLAVSASI